MQIKGVINRGGHVLDIKMSRGQERIVKMCAALIFAKCIKRNSQVPFN